MMNVKLNQILSAVCGYYQTKASEMFDPTRVKPIVTRRQIFTYLALTETGSTLMEVIRFIESASGQTYDHATLMHSRNKIRNEIRIYPDVSEDVENIKASFHSNKLIPHDFDLLQISIHNTLDLCQ